MIISYFDLPLITVSWPFLLALAVAMLVRKGWSREKQLQVIIGIVIPGIVLMSFFLGIILLKTLRGEILESVFWLQMIPFQLSFRVDGLSITIALLSLIIWVAIFIYSLNYIKRDLTRYYILLLLLLGSVLDTLLARDLVNFYIFLEIMTIVTYFLIIHNRDIVALKAGYKYLIMLIGGAFLILLSIIFAYQAVGNYEMITITTCGNNIVPIFFLAGCLLKAGAIPFHVWLPDAHPAAPSPISAFLSGIMIKVGIYGIIRVLFPFLTYNFALNNIGNLLSIIIVWVGIISMFIGVFLALLQSEVKKLLAYHSISQIGYILLGIGLGTTIGLTGSVYHLINHAIFKGLLFLAMGAVIFRVGSQKLIDLGGLGKKMPVTTVTCIIAALSISGLPPFNGFASKMLLGKAVGEFNILYKYLLTFASAFTFASFFKLIKYTFFGAGGKSANKIVEVPMLMLIPMMILSLFCLILGLSAHQVTSRLVHIITPQSFSYPESIYITFWDKSILFDSLLVVTIGWTVYFLAVKFGLIGNEDKTIISRNIWAERISCLSINSFYCGLAVVVRQACYRINRLHSRDLNIYLSWIPLTLVILYLILSF